MGYIFISPPSHPREASGSIAVPHNVGFRKRNTCPPLGKPHTSGITVCLMPNGSTKIWTALWIGVKTFSENGKTTYSRMLSSNDASIGAPSTTLAPKVQDLMTYGTLSTNVELVYSLFAKDAACAHIASSND